MSDTMRRGATEGRAATPSPTVPHPLPGGPTQPAAPGPALPQGRGSLSDHLVDRLRHARPGSLDAAAAPPADDAADAALALWTAYELHYRGFAGVDDAWEWDPDLLAVRAGLERKLEQRLRDRFDEPDLAPFHDDLAGALFDLLGRHEGRSLARHVQSGADEKQVLELLRLRSLYHLKEMDPTSFTLPRLTSRAQAGLAEVMYDEYGSGHPSRVHAGLFARGLTAAGVDVTAPHVDEAPAEVLEQNNAMSLFGLHRRLRGAAVGHFAAFEATSSVPSRRLAQGLRRLDLPEELVAYYEEHVEADAVHDQLAVRMVCGALVEDEPHLLPDVLLGAWTCLDLEDRVAECLLDRWGVAA